MRNKRKKPEKINFCVYKKWHHYSCKKKNYLHKKYRYAVLYVTRVKAPKREAPKMSADD